MTPTLSILGSGSTGNCALVTAGDTRILIDAGLSVRQIILRLQEFDLNPYDIAAIVLTHEHNDHIGALETWAKYKTPIYANAATANAAGIATDRIAAFQTGKTVRIGAIELETFPIPHDAIEPVGFAISAGNESIGYLTDLGSTSQVIRDRLRTVQTLYLESNHDERMVYADKSRPWRTKQRILGKHGHLSNWDAAGLIASLAGGPLRSVVLGHLSRKCNTPELAIETARQRLDGAPMDIQVSTPEKTVTAGKI